MTDDRFTHRVLMILVFDLDETERCSRVDRIGYQGADRTMLRSVLVEVRNVGAHIQGS